MSEVTVPVQDTEVEYDVVGPTTGTFAVPFSFFQTTDVRVITVDSAGVSTEHELITDWVFSSLEIPAGQEGIGFQSAFIEFNSVIEDVTLKIFRDTTIDRVTNFQSTGPFSIVQLNHELSQSIAIMQELRTNKNKYLNLPNDSVDGAPYDAELRPICNAGESESPLCLSTNRQSDAQGPNFVQDDDDETGVGATDQWNPIFLATGVVIQGTVTDTTKTFDMLTQFFCLIQNRNANTALFRIRVRYTVDCYAEVTKETNATYHVEIPGNSGFPLSLMDIEQDIDYWNGNGTMIVAIDIRPNGPDSGNLYCQWSNGAVNTSEPR